MVDRIRRLPLSAPCLSMGPYEMTRNDMKLPCPTGFLSLFLSFSTILHVRLSPKPPFYIAGALVEAPVPGAQRAHACGTGFEAQMDHEEPRLAGGWQEGAAEPASLCGPEPLQALCPYGPERRWVKSLLLILFRACVYNIYMYVYTII